jgi:hypothetical protein
MQSKNETKQTVFSASDRSGQPVAASKPEQIQTAKGDNHFARVRKFFTEWGLAPSDEPDDDHIANANGEYVMNVACFRMMHIEADRQFGTNFSDFVSQAIDATDGAYYLGAETWSQLEEAWDAWNKVPPV